MRFFAEASGLELDPSGTAALGCAVGAEVFDFAEGVGLSVFVAEMFADTTTHERSKPRN